MEKKMENEMETLGSLTPLAVHCLRLETERDVAWEYSTVMWASGFRAQCFGLCKGSGKHRVIEGYIAYMGFV